MGNAHFPRFCPFYRWGQWSSEESGVGQGHPANWISTQGHGTGLSFSFCFHLKRSHLCIHLEGRLNCLKPANWWNMRKSCAVRPCVLQLSTELEIAGAPGWVWNLSLAAGFGVCRGELWLLFKLLRWKWGSACLSVGSCFPSACSNETAYLCSWGGCRFVSGQLAFPSHSSERGEHEFPFPNWRQAK